MIKPDNFIVNSIKFVTLTGLLLVLINACSTNTTDNKQTNEVINQNTATENPEIAAAKKVFSKSNCLTCHSLDGARLTGPTFKGLYNSKVSVVENGKEIEVVADDAYLKESIVDPKKQVSKDFPAVMESYSDELSDDEITEMVESIKKVK